MGTAKRRVRVMFEPNDVVARKLRESPGEWFLVGTSERRHQRVAAQTAWRIRTGRLTDFAAGPDGSFEALSTADTQRPDPVAEVELYCRFVPCASVSAAAAG